MYTWKDFIKLAPHATASNGLYEALNLCYCTAQWAVLISSGVYTDMLLYI